MGDRSLGIVTCGEIWLEVVAERGPEKCVELSRQAFLKGRRQL